jgi:hypothetical protein
LRPDLTCLALSPSLAPSTWITFLSSNREFDTMSDSDLQAVTRYLEDNQQVVYLQGTGLLVLSSLNGANCYPVVMLTLMILTLIVTFTDEVRSFTFATGGL